jgi:nicotinamide-nucleotide amidase
MRIEIISIDNKLSQGQVLDGNAKHISAVLSQIGLQVMQITVVPDKVESIIEALAATKQRNCTIVIITGGLGCTSGEVTIQALSKYLDCPAIVLSKERLSNLGSLDTPIIQHLARRVASSTHTSDLQFGGIDNPLGTAPGIYCKQEDAQILIALPDVASEMQIMLQNTVLPYLQSNFALPAFYQKTICTIGIPEEEIAAILAPWEERLPSAIQLAYLSDLGTVKVRLMATLLTWEQSKQLVEQEIEKVLPLIEGYIYGYNSDTIEGVVGKLLKQQGKTLSVAESCTGGYVSQLITQIPGSSTYYQGGVVAYNNTVKHQVLSIPDDVLLQYGAVSQEVAIEMARNVRVKLKADIGLATTGIAGPGGGTAELPVGTVWIAYADKQRCYAKKLQLINNRLYNIQLTAYYLLGLLRKELRIYS